MTILRTINSTFQTKIIINQDMMGFIFRKERYFTSESLCWIPQLHVHAQVGLLNLLTLDHLEDLLN